MAWITAWIPEFWGLDCHCWSLNRHSKQPFWNTHTEIDIYDIISMTLNASQNATRVRIWGIPYIYIRMCAYLLIIFLSISIPISIHLFFHIAIYLYKYLYIYVSLYIYIKMRVCVFHEELDSHPLGRWPILRAWRIPAMRGRSWWSPIHW